MKTFLTALLLTCSLLAASASADCRVVCTPQKTTQHRDIYHITFPRYVTRIEQRWVPYYNIWLGGWTWQYQWVVVQTRVN